MVSVSYALVLFALAFRHFRTKDIVSDRIRHQPSSSVNRSRTMAAVSSGGAPQIASLKISTSAYPR